MRVPRVGDTVVMDKPKSMRGKRATITEIRWDRATNGAYGKAAYLRFKNGVEHTRSGYLIRYPFDHFHLVNRNGIGGFGDWMRKVAEK